MVLSGTNLLYDNAHTYHKAQQKYPAVWVGLSNNLHLAYTSCLVITMVFSIWKVAQGSHCQQNAMHKC